MPPLDRILNTIAAVVFYAFQFAFLVCIGYLVATLIGCGPRVSEPVRDYYACLDYALARAQIRVDTECRGYTYDGCPATPAIRAELQERQEQCE